MVTATNERHDAHPFRRWGLALVVIGYIALLVGLVSLGSRTTLPEEEQGLSRSAGSLNAVLQQTLAKPNTTDFLIDYASARALRDGVDPYAVSAGLIDRIGAPAWPVMTANPHPPTTLVVVLPFTYLSYPEATAAWALAMIFVLVATVLVMGVPAFYAVPIGVGLAITFPGAYGIGNVVPLIGLGIAIAYRYRDRPVVAAIGICLAAAPKSSGLIIAIPFLLTMRWRVVGWSAGLMAVIAAIPVVMYRGTWQRYLDAGTAAIDANFVRDDNGSLLNLAEKVGLPRSLALVAIAAVAVAAARVTRDTFWPAAWFSVAALPIAWMYSLLTFLPLAVIAVRSGRRLPTALVLGATGLLLATPPLGEWPITMVPLVNLVMCGVLFLLRDGQFWPDQPQWRGLLLRRRAVPATAAQPEVVAAPRSMTMMPSNRAMIAEG